MSYYCEYSYEDYHDQCDEECDWYAKEFPSCNTSYNFIMDEGYSYDHVYCKYVCSKPPQDTHIDYINIERNI